MLSLQVFLNFVAIMQKLFVAVCFLGLPILLLAQPKPTGNSPALLTFSDKNKTTVSKAEFEYVYQKNSGGQSAAKNHTAAQYRDYLSLYTKFKRKVIEAYELGLDTSQSFKDEFMQYQKQLSQPYLIEREVLDKLITEAYQRYQFRIKASHILIKCTIDANPADSLQAYQKAIAIRDSVLKYHQTFENMAKHHSDDPSAATNGGDLGFFTVFEMVYPFETGAYQTPKGEISMPIRSQYGYHLIKVADKQPAQGSKRAAHIIIRYGENYRSKDSTQALQLVNELYRRLTAGEDFAELAKEFSEDPNTAKRGGDLGTDRLLPEMDNAKANLKKGEFSKPFQTRFGYHILKVTEETPLKTFEQAKAELKGKVSKDSRAKISEKKLIERLKKEYNFKQNTANIQKFEQNLKQDYVYPNFTGDSLGEALAQLELFSFADKQYTVKQLLAFNQNNRNRNNLNQSIKQALANDIDAFIEKMLLDYEQTRLEFKYPEFRNLVKEYKEGILLFTLTEKKVWKRAVEDTIGLKTYYESHKDSFPRKESVRIKEYRASDSTVLAEVKTMLQNGQNDVAIDTIINVKTSKLRIIPIIYEKESNALSREMANKQLNYTTPIKKEVNVYLFYRLAEILPVGIKTYEEAKAECITRYQTQLEKEWEVSLEKNYPVKINEEVFKTLFK